MRLVMSVQCDVSGRKQVLHATTGSRVAACHNARTMTQPNTQVRERENLAKGERKHAVNMDADVHVTVEAMGVQRGHRVQCPFMSLAQACHRQGLAFHCIHLLSRSVGVRSSSIASRYGSITRTGSFHGTSRGHAKLLLELVKVLVLSTAPRLDTKHRAGDEDTEREHDTKHKPDSTHSTQHTNIHTHSHTTRKRNTHLQLFNG